MTLDPTPRTPHVRTIAGNLIPVEVLSQPLNAMVRIIPSRTVAVGFRDMSGGRRPRDRSGDRTLLAGQPTRIGTGWITYLTPEQAAAAEAAALAYAAKR